MRSVALATLFGALAFAAPLFVANTAHADASLCSVLTSKSCELVVGGGCTASCTPVHLTASCGLQCQDECHVEASTSCIDSCTTTTTVVCTPGKTTCREYCSESCYGGCEASCNESGCQASCEGSCDADCAVECQTDPPDCDAIRETSCHASCHTEANLECQVSCQGGCTADLEGGCRASCEDPWGGLFCDGQWVDITEDCAVTFGFEASVSCMAAPAGRAPTNGAAIAAIAAGIALVFSRRRRASKK